MMVSMQRSLTVLGASAVIVLVSMGIRQSFGLAIGLSVLAGLIHLPISDTRRPLPQPLAATEPA